MSVPSQIESFILLEAAKRFDASPHLQKIHGLREGSSGAERLRTMIKYTEVALKTAKDQRDWPEAETKNAPTSNEAATRIIEQIFPR